MSGIDDSDKDFSINETVVLFSVGDDTPAVFPEDIESFDGDNMSRIKHFAETSRIK